MTLQNVWLLKATIVIFQFVLLSLALFAVASALPAGPPYGHPAPHHAPPPKHYGDPYKIPPRPFSYAYGVNDEYSGASFDKKETQDEHGVVSGEYRIALPDGRTQIVTYHADHQNGFIADVKFEGKPHHPPAAHKPYHPPPPPPKHYGHHA